MLRNLKGSILFACALVLGCSGSHSRKLTPEQFEPSTTKYYVVMYGYQNGADNKAALSHSFASFIALDRAPAPNGPTPKVLSHHDISWIPAATNPDNPSVCVSPTGLPDVGCPTVQGHNFKAAETLRMGHNGHRIIKYWIAEITEELFELARDREAYLEDGRILYIANDTFLRQDHTAINCIHALSDMEPGSLPDTGLVTWGYQASKNVMTTYEMRGWIRTRTGSELQRVARVAGVPSDVALGD
jgi:hypothetical protein